MSNHIVTLKEDDEGNLILPLPKELFDGDNPWMIEDELEWSVKDDDTLILTNVSWMQRNHDDFK